MKSERPVSARELAPLASYASIRQHTSAYVSIRQNTSAYVSIRQHTSAYVRIRQNTSEYGVLVEVEVEPILEFLLEA